MAGEALEDQTSVVVKGTLDQLMEVKVVLVWVADFRNLDWAWEWWSVVPTL